MSSYINNMEQVSLSKELKKRHRQEIKENLSSGNGLRGEFLHHCSKIEFWLCNSLHQLKLAKKENLFVGRKLSIMIDAVKKTPDMFKNNLEVEALLEQFKAYAQIRTTMAHAHLEISSKGNSKIVYLFTMPKYNKEGRELTAMAVEHQAFITINSDLARLANQIKQQELVKEDT